MIATGVNNGITRRTFVKLAASGLVARALALDSLRPLDVGIAAYSYHNLTVDAMIAQLSSLKISEIEMSRGEFMVMNHRLSLCWVSTLWPKASEWRSPNPMPLISNKEQRESRSGAHNT